MEIKIQDFFTSFHFSFEFVVAYIFIPTIQFVDRRLPAT